MSESVKVLVYTRQALVREGLKHVLPAGHDVVGASDSRVDLLYQATALKPDVLILDAASAEDAIEPLTNALRLAAPSAKLILVNGVHEQMSLTGHVLRIDSRRADTQLLTAIGAPAARVVLTERQTQILRHVANGLQNKEIAKTVEFHRARVMRKLGLKSVAQLARFAAGRGLV